MGYDSIRFSIEGGIARSEEREAQARADGTWVDEDEEDDAA